MITELTQEQIALFPKYVEEFTQKGLTTERCKEEDAKIDFFNFQKHILKKETPAPVVLLDSPSACWKKVLETCGCTEKDHINFVWPYFDCQFWAGWFAFYEFFKNEFGIKYNAEYDYFKNCVKYGMVFPLDELCIVCQPPTVIKTNKNGLHCEDGPALSYSGMDEIYSLNGVVMKKEHVMTRAENLNPSDILKEENVEVRRELIRKVGIDRLLNNLPNKLLDKRDDYELYSVKLSDDITNAKFLKMINPSIGVYHVEGVDPSINTVSEALKWRNNNMFEDAEELT